MYEPGQKLFKIIQNIKSDGINVKNHISGESNFYEISDDACLIRIEINPKRWLGMDFDLKGTRITYSINTDLYDMASPENADFVAEIESDITNFLLSLSNGKAKIIHSNRKSKLLIPIADSYILLKGGLFFSSATILTDKKKVNDLLDNNKMQTFTLNQL